MVRAAACRAEGRGFESRRWRRGGFAIGKARGLLTRRGSHPLPVRLRHPPSRRRGQAGEGTSLITRRSLVRAQPTTLTPTWSNGQDAGLRNLRSGFDSLRGHLIGAWLFLDAAPSLPLAQRTERRGPNATVPGSSPGRETTTPSAPDWTGSALHCGLKGFESSRRHCEVGKFGRSRGPHKPELVGSNPALAPVPMAQLVGRRLDTAEVGGSNPSRDTYRAFGYG
jgi:hypothetical protein